MFQVGDEVQICKGPFKGTSGILLSIDTQYECGYKVIFDRNFGTVRYWFELDELKVPTKFVLANKFKEILLS